ncbi:hypothetical protein [Actinomadura sp. WMMB 499]|uniref:hypothetical protein n=1 Tax=Actinomadura sp. WMMB 499 TaxID=1219491 RepID=UPI001243A1D7|nr:hypothetical protein [Actinomadura sp. WMMB 499]QFG24674.1 hypothetical protein F7P10_29545 [Actinomadura sp. WMMB 499]
MYEAAEPGRFFSINIGENINNGFIGGSQDNNGRSNGAGSSAAERSPMFVGKLSPQDSQEAAEAFVPPENFKRTLRALEKGLVFLAQGRGTGRRTMARNLLRDRVGAGVVHHLDDTLDLRRWRPGLDGATGYLVDGVLGGLLRRSAFLTSLVGDLRDAGAAMVVVLPEDDELVGWLEDNTGFPVVRCVPPPGKDVLFAHLMAAIPDETRRSRLLDGVSPEFLEELLPPGAAPGAALQVLDALYSAEQQKVTPAERPSFILAELTAAAHQEIAERLAVPLEDAEWSCLVASAVFAGEGQHVLLEQAEQLHATMRENGGAPSVAEPDIATVLPAVLDRFRIRLDLVRTPGRPPRTSVVFAYPMRTVAILRHAWRKAGIDRGLLSWLRGIEDEELVEHAGWALAQSVPQGPGTGGLRSVQGCVTSGGPLAYAVAASGMRALLVNPDTADEARGRLYTWASSERAGYRITAALTCGSRTGTAPLHPALPILRQVIRSAEEYPSGRVDRVVDDAVMQLFLWDDRIEVLRALVAWSGAEGPEARYMSRIVPRLLRADPRWFESKITDSAAVGLVIALLTRTILSRDSGHLREVVLRWRRSAERDASRRELVDALLFAVGENSHPRVRHFLAAINRHDRGEA